MIVVVLVLVFVIVAVIVGGRLRRRDDLPLGREWEVLRRHRNAGRCLARGGETNALTPCSLVSPPRPMVELYDQDQEVEP